MFDVAAIGELLIDFVCAGENTGGSLMFAGNAGGAPANVLAADSKLGGETAFIGKVGGGFGLFLKNTLDSAGISTKGLVMSDEYNTALSFVQLNKRGDRCFSFYRDRSADMMITPSEVNEDILKECRIFHFGSVSLTNEPARGTTFSAVKFARENGSIISFDPNYRPPLWKSEKEAAAQINAGIALADIVKLSEEEMILLTGESDPEKGSLSITARGASLVLISLGCKGAFYRKGDLFEYLPTYDVKTIDTTGAGDAFLGAVLYRLRGKTLNGIKALPREELKSILSFANAAGSLATAKHGAINAMPGISDIDNCIKNVPLLIVNR